MTDKEAVWLLIKKTKTDRKAAERQTARQKDKKGHIKVQQDPKAEQRHARRQKKGRQTGRRRSIAYQGAEGSEGENKDMQEGKRKAD